MLRTVYLHGAAAAEFGPSFRLWSVSLAEACRGLSSQLKGFQQYLIKHDFRVIWGDRKTGMKLSPEMINFKLPAGDIHIVPAVSGAKKGGIGKIIAGLLIAAVAFWAAIPAGGLGATLIGGMTYGNLAVLGLGLAASGLSQMLTNNKTKKTPKSDSFMFNGAVNVTDQGGPVPLIYGRCRVGSIMISAGVSTADIPIGGDN